MKLTFDRASVNYIGNSYLGEFKEVGFLKPIPLDKALGKRKKLKTGEIIKISYGTRLEKFLWSMIKSDKSSKLSIYRLVFNEIMKINNRYISSKDYEELKRIIAEYQDVYNNHNEKNGLNIREENKKKNKKYNGYSHDQKLKENDKDLNEYVNDIALMIIYFQNLCLSSRDAYVMKYENVISNKQRNDINNFYALMDSNGLPLFSKLKQEIETANEPQHDNILNIQHIKIKYNVGEVEKTLTVKSPLLIRMMLYEFAKEYYPFIEGADNEEWMKEIIFLAEESKGGRPKSSDYKFYKAMINAYLGFVEHEQIYKHSLRKDDKYILLGRVFTLLGGMRFYIENDFGKDDFKGYDYEGEYYKIRLSKRVKK